MSSPVGHALAGLIVFTIARRFNPGLHWAWLLVFIVLAGLPDLDFVYIWALGLPKQIHHRTIFHSVVFAVVVGMLVAWLYRRMLGKPAGALWVLFPLTILSHDVMDMLCIDPTYPFGVQLLWPFSSTFYYMPVWFMKSAGYYAIPATPVWLSILKATPGELLVVGAPYIFLKLIFYRLDRLKQSENEAKPLS